MRLPGNNPKSEIEEELRNITDKEVKDCYQCMKCSAGCPYIEDMEDPPHRIILMAKLGLYDRVLKSNSLWTCAACMTCSARCPRDIEPAKIMEGLRALVLRGKDRSKVPLVYKRGLPQQAYIASMRKLRG